MQETLIMSPELQTRLQLFRPGTYCAHRSWGVGRVKQWEEETEQMVIDFTAKPGHLMHFEYAAQSLNPIAATHIEARLLENIQTVRELAKENPVELVEIIVESLGKDATPERIEKVLSPRVIAAADWKKWWEQAKKALKKDPRCTLPAKRNEPVVFHEKAEDQQEAVFDGVYAAIGAEAFLKAVSKLQKFWNPKQDKKQTQELAALANKAILSVPRAQPELALELALLRDEWMEEASLGEHTGPLSFTSFVPEDTVSLGRLIVSLPAVKQPQALNRLKKLHANRWQDTLLSLVLYSTPRMLETILEYFEEAELTEQFLATLEKGLRERQLTPDQLVWICKNRKGALSRLDGPQIFRAILAALEYDQLADYKKGTRLHDLLINDKDVLRDLIGNASEQDVRDMTRSVLLTSVFQELNKRSFLAAWVKLHPFVQKMIAGGEGSRASNSQPQQANQNQGLIVSWESLEKRKEELEDIIQKKIPANTKEIATAREYGDLRENHEFKAAKEMQTVLMRRKAELEQMIATAQGTDFSGAKTDAVNIGTRVRLKDIKTGESLTYTILGAWDSAPEKGIISYLAAVAKELLGKKPGDQVSLPMDHGQARKVKVESIEKYAH